MRIMTLRGFLLSIPFLAAPVCTAAQDVDALRLQLASLIHAAPVTDENPEAIPPATFGRQAEQILRAFIRRGELMNLRPPPAVEDSLATELHYSDTRYWLGELEGALHLDGPVYSNVRIETFPPGLDVRYRALASPPAVPLLTVTTPRDMELEAAWYVFHSTDPVTGSQVEKIVDCSSDATVVFRFPAEVDGQRMRGPQL